MFKSAISTMLATLAVADINEDFSGLLNDKELLSSLDIAP